MYFFWIGFLIEPSNKNPAEDKKFMVLSPGQKISSILTEAYPSDDLRGKLTQSSMVIINDT